MDWIVLAEFIATFVAGGSIIELFRYFSTRREMKRSVKLENDTKEAELEDIKKDSIVDGWEKLASQYQKDIEYYRTLIDDRDNIIKDYEEKLMSRDELIGTLREEINNLSSENTALKLTKCEKIQCTERIPPFGFKKLDIQNGLLIEDN